MPESAIRVCGLREMPEVVERRRPGRLIALRPADDQPPTPLQIRASDRLRALVDDISEPREGWSTPAQAHIQELISFLRSSPPNGSIVIHCLPGVSRSPGAFCQCPLS